MVQSTQVIGSIKDNIREPELLDYLESVFYHVPVRISSSCYLCGIASCWTSRVCMSSCMLSFSLLWLSCMKNHAVPCVRYDFVPNDFNNLMRSCCSRMHHISYNLATGFVTLLPVLSVIRRRDWFWLLCVMSAVGITFFNACTSHVWCVHFFITCIYSWCVHMVCFNELHSSIY